MDNAFMQEAIRQAVENVRSGRGGPFAAMVVKDGRVIASGIKLRHFDERSHGARGSESPSAKPAARWARFN